MFSHRFLANLLPILLLGAFFLIPTPALAQEGTLRLTTSPLPINLATPPGTPVSADIRVKNEGTAAEELTISVLKFRAFETTGAPELMEREPQDAFIDWVTFSEKVFTVAPGEWKTVTATWNPPADSAFGYYYALVFTRADQSVDVGQQQTALLGGTAVLCLLDVRVPFAKKEVSVVQFAADRSWYEFLPATFTVKLKNSGNVHVAPRGNVFINRGSEKDVAVLEVNPGQGNILPDSERVFSTDWSDAFPVYEEAVEDGRVLLDEQGQQIKRLRWDWSEADKLRFGKYTAKLLLVYDDGTRDIPIEGEVQFWVMPWRILLGTLVILVLALTGLKSTLQNLWKKFFGRSQA